MCRFALCVNNAGMEIKDSEKLVAAFKHMVDGVSQSVQEAEEALAPTIDEMVHNAQQMAREIHALTQEEAQSLGDSLKRDIHKANRVLNQQRKELRDWLSFDLALAEDGFIDLVARAADKTWLDLRAFENESGHGGQYRQNEVCNAGSFRCIACDHVMRLPETGIIPVCPNCNEGLFERVSR